MRMGGARLQPRSTHTAWLAASAVVAIFALNISVPSLLIGLAPTCAFKSLTGYDCPLCGGTRAVSALARGDIASAWRFNAAVVLGLAAAPAAALVIARRRARGAAVSPSRTRIAWAAGLGLLAAWGVLRNISL